MTHGDWAGDPLGQRAGQRAGSREAAGDAGHRQGFPTPAPIRPLPVLPPDRNGGFPRLSDGVPHGLRCLASPRHALLAERLGKPSLWAIIKDLWYRLPDQAFQALGQEQGFETPQRKVERPPLAR